MSECKSSSNIKSTFESLLETFERNKENKWNDWLSFNTMFKKLGKQGFVGTMSLKDDSNKGSFVFKFSQYINYLVNHEYVVMKGLNELSNYCVHFCRTFGIIKCDVIPDVRKTDNPFEIEETFKSIEKDVLLCENINKSCKFYNYIRAVNKVKEDVLYSTIKQVLMGILIAQKVKKFSHYDLHSYNIMMKKCDKDIVFLYIIDDKNQFCVPTFGHYPVIIDFGFSYISDMDDSPLWTSLAHTNVGFMSSNFDWVADPKLFLVTVSDEIKKKRRTKKSKKLRRIVRNIFYPLKIDWESGWDDIDDCGATDYVIRMIDDYNQISGLFKEYSHYCIDFFHSLIVLPLEEQDYSNIHISYLSFLEEWVKIENQVNSPFYNLYILKNIVNLARHLRASYTNIETRKDSVRTFRRRLHEIVDKKLNFFRPKNINYEKMLCSMYVFSRSIEGILYDIVSIRNKEKEREYSKLPLNSIEKIYASIETNIQSNYIFNKKTRIVTFNMVEKKTDIFKLKNEQIDVLNKTETIFRGVSLFKMYSNLN